MQISSKEIQKYKRAAEIVIRHHCRRLLEACAEYLITLRSLPSTSNYHTKRKIETKVELGKSKVKTIKIYLEPRWLFHCHFQVGNGREEQLNLHNIEWSVRVMSMIFEYMTKYHPKKVLIVKKALEELVEKVNQAHQQEWEKERKREKEMQTYKEKVLQYLEEEK